MRPEHEGGNLHYKTDKVDTKTKHTKQMWKNGVNVQRVGKKFKAIILFCLEYISTQS
jgi:hypothetical protein